MPTDAPAPVVAKALADLVIAELEVAAEVQTEDEHPAPELVCRLDRLGIDIVGDEPGVFGDLAYDLWQRINASEDTIHRYADWTPGYPVQQVIERVQGEARADLEWACANHLRLRAARVA